MEDTTQKKMRYLSLFSGIGGFELGIQQAYENLRPLQQSISKRTKDMYDTSDKLQQWECVGYSEIDKYAIQIYEKHFNHKNYGDITKINAEELPDFDLLVGGFPCQSFSIAGKRKGFDDTRGTLFFDIARILRAKQPKLFLLENVKGLLSHDNGKTFSTIISTLTELGYDLQWQVLNSKNHGVPQNRERIFIIGHLRGTRRPKVFPIRESNEKNLEQLNNGESQGYRVYGIDGIAPTQASQAGGVGAKTGLIAHTVRNGGRASGIDKKQNWDTYNFNGIIRRLTPTECERLQGFPDGWTDVVSDTQRYKCLGNAVTVNVIRDIIIKLFNHP